MSRRHSRTTWIAFALAVSACEPRAERPAKADILAARQAALSFDQRMKREIIDRIMREEDPVAVYLAYADHVPGWGKEISDAALPDFSRTAKSPRLSSVTSAPFETRYSIEALSPREAARCTAVLPS